MSWYNPSIAKARQEDTPRNPVILATCQVIEEIRSKHGVLNIAVDLIREARDEA